MTPRIVPLFLIILSLLTITVSPTLSHASILVVAPHPDDDVITSAGVIYRALQRGEQVRVVYMTNGDFYNLQAGYQRQGEAVAGDGILGVAEDSLIFLGSPDGYVDTIRTSYKSVSDQFVSPNGISTTDGNRGLGRADYHTYSFGAPGSYNAPNIIADIEDILITFRPDHILVTSQFDIHSDHSATYLLLRLALTAGNNSNPSYSPLIHDTVVHYGGGWPNGIDPTALFTPIPNWSHVGFAWSDRESLDVPIRMQSTNYAVNPKYLAISTHASQQGSAGFLGTFIHKDEFFWLENVFGNNHPPIVSAGPDQTVAEGVTVNLDGSQSRDPDGTLLS